MQRQSQDDKVSAFCVITGVPSSWGREFLRHHEWHLANSIAASKRRLIYNFTNIVSLPAPGFGMPRRMLIRNTLVFAGYILVGVMSFFLDIPLRLIVVLLVLAVVIFVHSCMSDNPESMMLKVKGEWTVLKDGRTISGMGWSSTVATFFKIWIYILGMAIAPSEDGFLDAAHFYAEYRADFGRPPIDFHLVPFKNFLQLPDPGLMFIYVHQSDDPDTEDFCTNTLWSNDVRQLLNTSFRCWGGSSKTYEGYKISNVLGKSPPFCAIAIRTLNGKISVLRTIKCTISATQMKSTLTNILMRAGPLLKKIRSRPQLLVSRGCINQISQLLSCSNEDIVYSSLVSLEAIIKAYEEEKEKKIKMEPWALLRLSTLAHHSGNAIRIPSRWILERQDSNSAVIEEEEDIGQRSIG